MPNSGTNNPAQANVVAGRSQSRTAADAKEAKKAENDALKSAKMQGWLTSPDDHLSHFLSYGGTAGQAGGSKLA